MSHQRTQHLSIYLLKPHIAIPADAIRTGARHERVDLPDDAPSQLSLFIQPTLSHSPEWLQYFPAETRNNLQTLFSASSGATIFVSARDRLFAVCFGTGWHLLRNDCFVRSFGLRAALSLVALNTLKAVDISTYDNFAKYRRVSTSKGTTIESFDIEGQLDLLRGVVGTSSRALVAQQIGGRDSCILWTRNSIGHLPKLCSILLRAYESGRVERRFPIISNVNLVRDPTEISRLDATLESVLMADPGHDITFAPPEVINWDDIDSFQIDLSGAPPPSIDLQFSALRNLLAPHPVTLVDLRKVGIQTVRPDGTPGMQRWSAYDCVVTEIADPNNPTVRCILMAGDWYVVASSFVEQVAQDLQAIPQHTARALPDAGTHDTETIYNASVVASDPNALSLLHAKDISYGGGRSRIEVCDFLSLGKQLYHIKDYHGSATLSHLFSQGVVSARLLLEADFRSKMRAKYGVIVEHVIPDTNITPSEYEVVFGIICEPSRSIPSGLPFFSKVRLLEAARELRRMGYNRVSTAKIARR